MRIVAILAALLALAAAQASAPAARPGGASTPLLAAVWFGEDAQLTRLDPLTLQPAGPRLSIGRLGAWGRSPAADQLAVGRVAPTGIRLFDTGRLARIGMVKLAPSGTVGRIAWLRPNRLVAVYAHFDGSWIAWVDTQARRVVKRRLLGADPPVTVTAGGRFVALIQPSTKIGAAKLAVATADGRLRVVRLPSIRIGTALPAKQGQPVRRVLPGLAVDPAGARAYVVGTDGVVAAVDLRSLRVATHRLRQATSLARAPAAATKSISGPILQAQWVGDGRLAVVGTTYRATTGKAGERQFSSALGLRLVDVRTWTQRTIDASATEVAIAGGALLAYGVLVDWDSKTTSYSGMGIATYGTDGSARSRILSGQPVGWVQVAGERAYGWLVEEENIRHVLVIDLASGTVERDLKLGRPTQILLGDGSSY